MATAHRPRYTPEEYLELERAAEYKSEYIDGEIYALAGASPAHTRIIWNIVGELSPQLKGRPCHGYMTEMKVRVTPTKMYTYPDVVIVCGEEQFADDQHDVLINPTVIFEVLSPSTEAYDRGGKFAHYRRLDSLTDYVLVAQNQALVEHFMRQGDQWMLSEISDLGAGVYLASVDCTLALAEIYDNVEFPDPPPPPPGHEHARLI